MRIGRLIDELKRFDPEDHVFYDFCRLVPTIVASYRGWYDQAALGWATADKAGLVTVEDLLIELAQSIDGRTYEGWKGGSFRYERRTPIWVDNPGACTGTEIVGVEKSEGVVILRTNVEDWA